MGYRAACDTGLSLCGNGDIMDRRDEELKILKKAYKREKRRATGCWKFFCFVSLVLCVLLVPGCVMLLLPGNAAVSWACRAVEPVFGSDTVIGWLNRYSNIFWIIFFIAVLVLIVSVIMWIAGSRKLKKTDAFLSYRTLRDTLKAEKRDM